MRRVRIMRVVRTATNIQLTKYTVAGESHVQHWGFRCKACDKGMARCTDALDQCRTCSQCKKRKKHKS